MNRIEAAVDRLDPRLSVRLRLLKKAAQRDLLLALVRRFVRAGDVVLDIGANRGVYTLDLARRVGPAGRVHSFDPVPINVRSLEALARAHRSIEVHPVALSSREGAADLHVPVEGRVRLDALARLGPAPTGHHDSLPVELATIDGTLGTVGAGRGSGAPTFVKCDVEGHEHEVLLGGRATLSTHLPALVVEIEHRHRQTDVAETIDLLLGWGYEGHTLSRRRVGPIADFDVARDQLAPLARWSGSGPMPEEYVGNFLFVRPGLV